MLLYYIRHGDPIYNPDSLTPLGDRQAESVGRKLSLKKLDCIYASSSTRAMETARPASEITHLPITPLDWCREDLAWKELTAHENGVTRWLFDDDRTRRLFLTDEILSMGQSWHHHPAFAGTPVEAGFDRIGRETDAFLLSLGYRHDRENHCYLPEAPSDRHVALFAHLGFGLAFMSQLLDIPYPLLSTRFAMCHTGTTAVSFRERDGIVIPQVMTFASEAHLYSDHLPVNYERIIEF